MLAAAAAFLALAGPVPADAALVRCEREAAEFQASMGSVAGASRMGMRFTLQVRTRRVYRRTAAPGFDTWTFAAPGVSRYVFTRRVEELIGPARYRVKVRFRWQDASGAVVASARRLSQSCRQPDRRPNLLVEQVTVEDGRYRVLVRNDGRSPAGAFTVAAGGESVRLDGLAARAAELVEVAAPPCVPGEPVVVAVDPEDDVDERSERDNEHAFACS